MAGSGKAVLDACALVPSTTRDALLSTAFEGAYQPVWSPVILDEVRRALARLHTHAADPMATATRQVDAMTRAFPEANVGGVEELIQLLPTNDPDDAHVLAAAVRAGADRVVTLNRERDFHQPGTTRLPELARRAGVRLLTPDQFLREEYAFDPQAVERALDAMVRRRTNPPVGRGELLRRMSAQDFPEFAPEVLAESARRQAVDYLRNLTPADDPEARVSKDLGAARPSITIGPLRRRRPRKDR